jgi:hypothetical protein
MQLLVWVLNHGLGTPTAGRLTGIAVGGAPQMQSLASARSITSFAEFRASVDVDDPLTELQLAVARALAQSGAFAPGQILEHETRRCRLRLRLEPGFDDARSVVEPLAQLLRSVSIRGGVVVNTERGRAVA